MRRFKGLVIGLLAMVVLGACSGSGEDSSQEYDSSTEEVGVEDSAGYGEWEEADSGDDSEEGLIGEKVIQTVHIDFETLHYDEAINHVASTIREHNAYIEYSYEQNYQPSGLSNPNSSTPIYRQISYTLRVPTEALSDFLAGLEGMDGHKTMEEIGTEDVTQTYRDTESRINVLQNKEDRLNALLEQAETIEDILQIEDNLSQTIAEREVLQSQLDNYDSLIDFTTVNLSIVERPRISSARGEQLSFFERSREAIIDSFYAFYYFIQDAVIWFIYALPFLMILGLIIWIVWFIVKRRNKKVTK